MTVEAAASELKGNNTRVCVQTRVFPRQHVKVLRITL